MSSFYEIIAGRARSEKTRQEFVACNVCDRKLNPLDMYVISKAYQDGACIFEAVQCVECQVDSREYASEQSMENITLYGGRRFKQFMQDPSQRELYYLEDPSCLITGENLTPSDTFELHSFNIPGSNAEENYIFVGPTAMEQMSELLSEETRKSWGRFTESLSPESPDIVVSPMFL